MSITRLQQARQMYALGQRVSKAFGGVMGMDGRRQYGGGSDAGKDGGYGYQGGGTNTAGVSGTGPASSGYGGGNTIGLAQSMNDATAYQTRPQEMPINYSTYAAPSFEDLYKSFLNMGIMGSATTALTALPWFGTTPNYYGAGQQNTG